MFLARTKNWLGEYPNAYRDDQIETKKGAVLFRLIAAHTNRCTITFANGNSIGYPS